MSGTKRPWTFALLAALAVIGAAAVLFSVERITFEPVAASPVAADSAADASVPGGSGVERTFGSPRRTSFL